MAAWKGSPSVAKVWILRTMHFIEPAALVEFSEIFFEDTSETLLPFLMPANTDNHN